MAAGVAVFLEGPADVDFFESVLRGELAKKYSTIETYRYSQRTKKQLKGIVETWNKRGHYIVFADFDTDSTCYSGRKDSLRKKIPNARHDRIAVVKTEIESWYLAGMGRDECRQLQIPHRANTESTSKEDFERMCRWSKSGTPKIVRKKMLGMFDVEIAKRQNASFEYVWNKFVSETS